MNSSSDTTTTTTLNNQSNHTAPPVTTSSSSTTANVRGANGITNGVPSTSINGISNNSSSSSGNAGQTETIKTFENLLHKSQRLIIGLRDLPQFGRQWQPFFQKTFEIYTKLWKFQQQYRSILEDKSKYGLKRCEIGEIASKIGQLYYHYYLRTSDTNYLHESFIFYEAIRLRAYFKEVFESKVPDMMVKQLRYYARFIAVCLLLNRKKVVFELVEELFKYVNEYTKVYKPQETQEWSLVLQEIFSFLQADQSITFTDAIPPSSQGNPNTTIPTPGALTTPVINISHRLNLNHFPALPNNQESIPILQQCILVGNHQNQIKFSEITLDMFRIIQSLEYEMPDQVDQLKNNLDQKLNIQDKDNNTSTPAAAASSSSNNKKKNPNKYLLYRPTVSQLILFLSNASKELSDNKALLLYLSVDGIQNESNENQTNNNSSYQPFYNNGLIMNTQKSMPTHNNIQTNINQNFNKFTETLQQQNQQSNSIRVDALYPVDLLPFCRKPFFLIVDSQYSHIFKDLPLFNQPFISLLSPVLTPKKIFSKSGNLFTFFLYDSLSAFCDITGTNKMSSKNYTSHCSIIENSYATISKVLTESENVHPSFSYFLLDDFLRSFILRFIFCHSTFLLHKDFQDKMYQASCNPELPRSISHNPLILNSILSLANALNVSDQFIDINNIK